MSRLWPRLFARLTLLAILLHASRWVTASPLAWGFLVIPLTQTLITFTALKRLPAAHTPHCEPWSSSLQRGYQGLLILLMLSTLIQSLSQLHVMPGGLLSLVGLSVSALSPDQTAEIKMEQDTPTRYHITCAARLSWSGNPAITLKNGW
jgi:hypothetical protein